ncbi:MAG: hypothetical protein H7338_14910 [Candidatus Sericytochromatia bacterium]|nr:hypothetical protein [Candidatus Sericytochromatia bacterium]
MIPSAAAPHPSVIATPLRDGETILLHLHTKRYFSLNAVGGQYWKVLQGTGTALSTAPDESAPFWTALLEQGLIVTCATGATPAAWPLGDAPPTLVTYPALAGITFLSGGGVAGPVVI